MDDETFMSEAVALARRALDDDGGPFGAVVVREGEIVGRGRNRVLALSDPTAHAEVLAIRDACRRLGTHDLSGCTVYTSCEPCPMCLGALLWARVDRIVYAVGREGATRAGFDDALVHDRIFRPEDGCGILMEQLSGDEARTVMEAWTARTDRTGY